MIVHIIYSSNLTTCPQDPVPSTTLQTNSQNCLTFIIITGDSITSDQVLIAIKTARVTPILKKPKLDTSDISNYLYHFFFFFQKLSCLSILPISASKILTSLSSMQHTPQKLPSWLLLRNFMPLGQTSCHWSSSSWWLSTQDMLTCSLKTLLRVHPPESWKAWNKLAVVCFIPRGSYQVTWRGTTFALDWFFPGVPQVSVLGSLLFYVYIRSQWGHFLYTHPFQWGHFLYTCSLSVRSYTLYSFSHWSHVLTWVFIPLLSWWHSTHRN